MNGEQRSEENRTKGSGVWGRDGPATGEAGVVGERSVCLGSLLPSPSEKRAQEKLRVVGSHV